MARISRGAQGDIALLKQGSYSVSGDIIKHRIWDSRYIPTTVGDHTFFAQGVGSSWRDNDKDLNETNLFDSGKLPQGQAFLVKKIGIGLIAPIEADSTDAPDVVRAFVNIIQSSVFELKIAGREWDYQIHGREFLPSIMLAADTGADESPARYGDMIASGWSSLGDTPLPIGQLVTFKVDQIVDNAIDYIKDTVLSDDFTKLNGVYAQMQVTLEGTLTRLK